MTINYHAEWWHLVPLYDDPVSDGWHATSPYVEEFWMPILGPTSIAMLRRFSVVGEQGSFLLNLVLAPYMFGLDSGQRSRSGQRFRRVIERLHAFDMLRPTDHDDEFAVRVHLPTLSHRQVGHLHPAIADRHATFMAEQETPA